MNIMRENAIVKARPFARYDYNITTGIGKNGARVTGSKAHSRLSRKVAAEGMVLLKNNGVLPMKAGQTAALFGIGSIDYVSGGGGSGKVFSAYVHNLYEAFLAKSPSFGVYKPLSDHYCEYMKAHMADVSGDTLYDRLFDEIALPADLMDAAAENSDLAVIVIHRFAGEGRDRTESKGDFYLTDEEEKLVADVTARFDRVVAVLNVGSVIDVGWIKDNDKIGAAIVAWPAGMEGCDALADIICGAVNPSGKLVDTFARRFSDYPSSDSFFESEDFVNYYEDIYVGYRYFETVKGAAERVVYPFGFGLSYTSFEISKPTARRVGKKIELSLSVTNVGDTAGKEVVQLYYSAPQGVLGKSALSLAAFKKTALLSPGATEAIRFSFPISQMASYDDLGKLCASAYLLEQGEYAFYAGNSVRDLKKADYVYTVKEPFLVVKQLSSLCAPSVSFKRLTACGEYEQLPAQPIMSYPEVEDVPYIQPRSAFRFTDVALGRVELDAFVRQLSNEQLVALVSGVPSRGVSNTCGMGGIAELGIPSIMSTDGPAGVRLAPDTGIATTGWPCATLIACTWDEKLMYKLGKAGAMEAKENALPIWLTPAINIHRNPLCGRNFEYFSEDPLVAGVFATAKVKGMQSVGVACSVKHFACNNKEGNRLFSDSRVSERALREIYLKPFEICVKNADPWTIMTSYNLINGRRCCENYEQIQGILRNEWGFKGMVTTDWGVPCNQSNCVKAGNDVRMPSGYPERLLADLESGVLKRASLEKCVHRLLSMFLKLNEKE